MTSNRCQLPAMISDQPIPEMIRNVIGSSAAKVQWKCSVTNALRRLVGDAYHDERPSMTAAASRPVATSQNCGEDRWTCSIVPDWNLGGPSREGAWMCHQLPRFSRADILSRHCRWKLRSHASRTGKTRPPGWVASHSWAACAEA